MVDNGKKMETTIQWVIWVVVEIMLPFLIPIIIRHLILRVPKRDHNFHFFTTTHMSFHLSCLKGALYRV